MSNNHFAWIRASCATPNHATSRRTHAHKKRKKRKPLPRLCSRQNHSTGAAAYNHKTLHAGSFIDIKYWGVPSLRSSPFHPSDKKNTWHTIPWSDLTGPVREVVGKHHQANAPHGSIKQQRGTSKNSCPIPFRRCSLNTAGETYTRTQRQFQNILARTLFLLLLLWSTAATTKNAKHNYV